MFRQILPLLTLTLLLGCRAAPPEAAISSLPTPSQTLQPTSGQVPDQSPLAPTNDSFSNTRLNMVASQIEGRGVSDPLVLEAMRAVPRHFFIPDEYLDQAYADHPLPIGYGQTISQPYIVALMTEALGLEIGDRVLEIGTGSGYQAAVLAEMGTEVYTIEIIPELAVRAEGDLNEAGYGHIHILNADGYWGWEVFAPFDAIIVTAAPDHLPQPLANQLKANGQLVIPIGPIGAVQTLWLFEKVGGELQALNLGAVRFVPFTRSGD